MIIKEFLPNPVGSDKDGEYIKIFNDADASINLFGWKISDASGKSFNLSGTIKPKEEIKLLYAQTKISLNNTGESVSLFDSKGALVDKLSYTGTAEEGKIILKQEIVKIDDGFVSGQTINNHFGPTLGKILYVDLFLALILGVVAVYVILQLEKELNKKLY